MVTVARKYNLRNRTEGHQFWKSWLYGPDLVRQSCMSAHPAMLVHYRPSRPSIKCAFLQHQLCQFRRCWPIIERTYFHVLSLVYKPNQVPHNYIAYRASPQNIHEAFSRGQFVIPTGRYSDRSIFRQVGIPTGRYSDRSLFRQVVIPTGRYSDRSVFRQVYIPTGRYSDRSIFRQVYRPILTGRYSDRPIFQQVYIPTGLYSDRSIFQRHVVIPTVSWCKL